MDLEINNIQFKRRVSLSELVTLPLNRPEIQRDLNQETIQKIIDFQSKRYEEKNSFLFIGDLQIALDVDNNNLYLIDGQHRYYSILNTLYTIMPEYIISLNFIKVSSINNDYPSIEDVFILINKYTPIPKYILECVNIGNYKLIIDQFRNYIKREYKQYISDAKKPRDPNINLDKMCNKIMSDSIIIFQYIKDGRELFEYMKYINSTLWVNFDIEGRGNKIDGRPFYGYVQYGLIKENDWVSSIELIERFKNMAINTAEESTSEQSDGGKRKNIPKKIKNDLWKKFYGENYNSLCLICNESISVVSFEAGHIISVAAGGSDNIDNLRPICIQCNRSMGAENMDTYTKKYYQKEQHCKAYLNI